MRVVSAVRNVRIIDDTAMETIEVVIEIDPREPSIAKSITLAEDSALKVAGKDKARLLNGNEAITLGGRFLSVMWITANKP